MKEKYLTINRKIAKNLLYIDKYMKLKYGLDENSMVEITFKPNHIEIKKANNDKE